MKLDMLRGARAVIVMDGEVLLGKRLKKDSFFGLWCTFGGGVEEGESPEQALKRELGEELGIEPLNPRFLAMIEAPAEDDPGETVELHYFLVTEWKGEVQNRSEHSDIGWFKPDELKDLPMGRFGRKVVEQYFAASP